MDEMDRYYQILGLKPDASEKEIVEAYKVLVKVWQPDRFSGDPNVQKIATEKIKQIDEAFKQLLIGIASHHERRKEIPEPFLEPPVQVKIEPSGKIGSIVVQTEPEGAVITINGEPVGISRYERVDLPPGLYKVRATLQGHEIWEHNVLIGAGAKQEVLAKLKLKKPESGEVWKDPGKKPYGTPIPSQQKPLYEPSSKPLPRDDLKRSTEQVVVPPLGNEKDSSVEKPINTSAFLKEISFNKLLLFIMLLPAAVILLDGFLGFTFYDLSKKLADSEFGIIVYIFYFSLGIWIADYIYKLRELTLIIVLSFIVLFFYRLLIAISLNYEFIGQVMINTLKEGIIVYASLSLFSFLFRYFEPRFDYAEICNIIEFTDPITKKKYYRGTCTKCGSITIVAKERAISFLGKSAKYFCDNCNRFLRGNPLNNIFLGLTEGASSLIFMLVIASSQ